MSDLGERSIRFWYTNYRGERSIRTAVPVILRWGQSQWHPRPQWLMTAFDMDKGAERTFALEDCQFITCDASDVHPDDEAVNRFAMVMKAKLAKKREDGRGGWQECSAEFLSGLLRGHVKKGDPVDVANLAMMLHQNRQSIIPTDQPETSDPQERLNVAAMEVAAYGVNIQRLRELEDAYHDFASSRMLRQGDT